MQQNDNATNIDPHTVEPPNMSNTNVQNANPDSPSHKMLPNADAKDIAAVNAANAAAAAAAAAAANQIAHAPSPAPNVNVSSGGSLVGVHTGPPASGEQQLKYENERLKMALAQRWVFESVKSEL